MCKACNVLTIGPTIRYI